MRTSAKTVLTALMIFFYSLTSKAEDSGFWSLALPTPESATNAVTSVDHQFLVKSVSFDWEGEDTAELRQFYGEFFSSIAWEDPMANSPRFSGSSGSGWSSYAMNFDDQNSPVAKFASMWKATEYPAQGAVTVQLNEYDDGIFKGTVVVQIAPEVNLDAIFRLSSLLGNDPENLFKLHAAVHGNPFELHTIALPANYREESDPLLSEYYQIVDEILIEYRKWERRYIAN